MRDRVPVIVAGLQVFTSLKMTEVERKKEERKRTDRQKWGGRKRQKQRSSPHDHADGQSGKEPREKFIIKLDAKTIHDRKGKEWDAKWLQSSSQRYRAQRFGREVEAVTE